MKYISVLFIAFYVTGYAQVPQALNYQAVARDNGNALLVNTPVAARFSILQNSVNGNTVYSEQQATSTNAYGLFTMKVGTGNVISGDFSGIDWSAGPYFLKVEINTGQGYQWMGTSQLLSVPYALHAGVADSIAGGNPGSGLYLPDPSQPVAIAFQGQVLYVHPSDNSTTASWGGFGIPVGSQAQSQYDGEANTAAIVATLGNQTYAAKICESLSAFGYTDWYLPSLQELDAVFKQAYLLQGLDHTASYWSSTEFDHQNAYAVDFSSWQSVILPKNQPIHTRCIRK